MAVYLQNWHLLPGERLAGLFQDLHGIDLTTAALAGMTRRATDVWRDCSERLQDLLVGRTA